MMSLDVGLPSLPNVNHTMNDHDTTYVIYLLLGPGYKCRNVKCNLRVGRFNKFNKF